MSRSVYACGCEDDAFASWTKNDIGCICHLCDSEVLEYNLDAIEDAERVGRLWILAIAEFCEAVPATECEVDPQDPLYTMQSIAKHFCKPLLERLDDAAHVVLKAAALLRERSSSASS